MDASKDSTGGDTLIHAAILAVVLFLILYYGARLLGLAGRAREKFASKRAREVHSKAQEVFTENGADASYSDYKSKVPGADPVQYKDVRGLYKGGSMTPENVEKVL